MNKNLLLGIFGNVAPEGKIIKYMSSEAVSGGWVDNNTDTDRNTFINGKGTLYLNDDVINIGGSNSTDYSPFYYKTDVTSIDLKYSGLVYINNDAFYGCTGLTSITIPDSVIEIGNSAFGDCSGLTSIVVNSENSIYDSRNNCNAIIETSTNTLITGCKNTIIPNSVTSIGDDAFWFCSGLTSITIPNSVTSIGNHAFYHCSSLTSVIISNSVTTISMGAFAHCSGLTSVTIANSVTTIDDGAFEHCSALRTITIPKSIESIDRGAFGWCNNLTSVTCLATTPPTLGRYNFTAENDTLYVPAESVELYQNSETWIAVFTNIERIPPMILYKSSQAVSGDWVTNNTDTSKNTYDSSTNEGVLYLNPGVTTIGGGQSTDYSPFYSNNNAAEIDLSLSGLTSIGNYALDYCISLTSIIIPNSVTSIGDDAFYQCSGLTSITIPDSITSIGDGAFAYCSGLTSVTISDSVASISNWAFGGCYNLTSVTIPDSVTSIGDNAFYQCSGLTSITIPDSVTSIGENAFSRCHGLTSIVVDSNNTTYDSRNHCNAIIETFTNTLIVGCQNTVIPNSVTSIGRGAFEGCSGLESIIIPNSVTSIGYRTFDGCSGLTSVTCLATTPPTLGSNNFTASDDILYVPSESVSTYQSNSKWSTAFTTITAINN